MKRRPIRKWIVRSLLVSLLLFLLFLGKLYWDWRSTRRAGEEHLARVMQELDESEPGWRDVFETRNQRLAPPEKNSAQKTLAILKSLPKELHDWCDQAKTSDEYEPNQLIPEQQTAELTAKLAPFKETIEQLKHLLHTESNSGFPTILQEPDLLETPLKDRQLLRHAGQILVWKCYLSISADQPNEGLVYCRSILGNGRTLNDDPLLLCQLVRLAQNMRAVECLQRILANHQRFEKLEEVQNDFRDCLSVEGIRYALRGERVIMDQVFENIDKGSLPLNLITKNDSVSFFEDAIWKHYRKYIPEQRAFQIQVYNNLVKSSEMPYPLRAERMECVLAPFRDMTSYDRLLVRSLFPAIDKIDQAEQRGQSLLSCAVVALACERFRIANDRWPNDLPEIPKSILPEVPNDPFTGGPLMMKRTEFGLNIYSTSKDGIDDGGEVLDAKMEPGTDIGFRLYDPAHRRKPAPVNLPVDDEGFPKP
jgi:hypothetical protein